MTMSSSSNRNNSTSTSSDMSQDPQQQSQDAPSSATSMLTSRAQYLKGAVTEKIGTLANNQSWQTAGHEEKERARQQMRDRVNHGASSDYNSWAEGRVNMERSMMGGMCGDEHCEGSGRNERRAYQFEKKIGGAGEEGMMMGGNGGCEEAGEGKEVPVEERM